MNRGLRKMPSAEAVAAYHETQGNLRDGLWPACFGCAGGKDSWGELERAHLIDRAFGGLDGPQNLVLLCWRCHREMPSFRPGDEAFAWAWVRSREHWMARAVREAQQLIDSHSEGEVRALLARRYS